MILEVLSNIFIILSLCCILLGLIGFFRFKTPEARLLNTAKIDSAGFMLMIMGLILKSGAILVGGKLALILVFFLLTNPLVNQLIANLIVKR